jgi:hypothetical protein
MLTIGAVLSVLIGMGSVAAGVWGARDKLRFGFPIANGYPLGNKEICAYRRGADFRIRSFEALAIFLLQTEARTAAQIAAEDAAWGRPNHWLKVPEFDLSLWWVFGGSMVLPGIWGVAIGGEGEWGVDFRWWFLSVGRVSARERVAFFPRSGRECAEVSVAE